MSILRDHDNGLDHTKRHRDIEDGSMSSAIRRPWQERFVQNLDPFAFHPDWRSRLGGGNGIQAPGDANYVFHTQYIDLPLGSAQFVVEINGLEGRAGTVTFVVHAFDGAEKVVRQLVSNVSITELVDRRGMISFSVAAIPGSTHALMAHAYGQLDAACTDISVQVIHTQPVALPTPEIPEHGPPLLAGNQLISLRPPQFASPSSQPCTLRQLAEPEFEAMARKERRPGESDTELWSRLIPYRIFDHYGSLRQNASLLQLGIDRAGMARFAHDAACHVTQVGDPSDTDAPSRSNFADVTFLPSEFHNHFDMVASGITPEDLGSSAAWSRFVLDSAQCLRRGGIAVYLCNANLSVDGETGYPHALSRLELERLCVKLMSRRLDLAQVRYGPADGDDTLCEIATGAVPFVIVVCRSIG